MTLRDPLHRRREEMFATAWAMAERAYGRELEPWEIEALAEDALDFLPE